MAVGHAGDVDLVQPSRIQTVIGSLTGRNSQPPVSAKFPVASVRR